MSDKKAKEFWIVDSSQLNNQATRVYNMEPKWLIGSVEWIKVVEYSAYQQVLDKIAELEVNVRLSDGIITQLQRAQKAQVEIFETKISLLEQDLESEKRSHRITMDSCNEYVEELKNEISTLTRALEMDSNTPMDRSQEAAHYNWLDDKYEKIEKQNEELIEVLYQIALARCPSYVAHPQSVWFDEHVQLKARQAIAKVKGEKNV